MYQSQGGGVGGKDGIESLGLAVAKEQAAGNRNKSSRSDYRHEQQQQHRESLPAGQHSRLVYFICKISTPDYRSIAVGTHADDGDGYADVVLDELDIVLESLRQLVVGGGTGDIGLPSGQLLIDSLAAT